MRRTHAIWLGCTVGALAMALWGIGRTASPSLARRVPESTPQEPTAALPTGTTAPRMPGQTPTDSEWQALFPQPPNDPSIDPEMLKRAYAPPPADMLPEAYPTSPAIEPPQREWRRLQRNDNAIAY